MTKHTLKFGGEFRKNTDMLLQTQDAGGPRGEFTFTANGTAQPGRGRVDDEPGERVCRVPARLAGDRAAAI